MPPAATPENEPQRLRALRECGVLDTGREDAFDDLTRLARECLGAPISLLSLIDADRSWFKSVHGLDVCQTPRDESLCAHLLTSEGALWIPDTLRDDRTSDNPLVVGDAGVRFFAGVPLRLASGETLGGLCVLDTEPREFNASHAATLEALGRQAMAQLELRRARSQMSDATAELGSIRHALEHHTLFSVTDRSGAIIDVNEGFCRMSGYTREELLGEDHRVLNSGHHPHTFWAEMWSVVSSGDRWRGEVCNRAKDGTLYWVDSTIVPYLGRDGKPEKYVSIRFDITRQKHAEEEAEKQRELAEKQGSELRTILDAVPALIYYKDDANTILDLNRAAAETIGLPPERIRGHKTEEFFPAEDAAGYLKDDRVVIESGKPRLGIVESYETAPNERRVIRTDKVPLRGPGGEFDHVLAVAMDITELTRTRRDYDELQSRFERAVAGSTDGLWEADLTTDKAWYSTRFKELLGFQPQDQHLFPDNTSCWRERIHPDDAEAVKRAFQAHLNDNTPFRARYRLRTRSGEYRWFQVRGEATRDESGRAILASGSMSDVHDQHTAESRLDLAMRSAQIGLWDLDLDTGECFASDTLYEMLGYSSGEFSFDSSRWQELIHPEDREGAHRALQDHVHGNASFYVSEHRVRRRDGAWVWIRDAGEVVERDEFGQPTRMVGVHVDIQALREAKDAAEAANLAKSEFLANMSHEIRTPMTAILGYADLLSEDGPDGFNPKEASDAALTIRSNANHLLTIINDILDMSKIEAGRMSTERIKTDPSQALDEVAGLIRPRAKEKGIELRVEHAGDLPESMLTDPTRLQQILLNLASNAVKFTTEGRITMRASWLRGERALCLSVEDTGIGMTPEQLARVGRFDAFTQADSSMSRRYGGTGLGLRISSSLARLLGGELTIESEPGRGTLTTLRVPCAEASAHGAKHPAHEVRTNEASLTISPDERPLEGVRVLVAEDGPDNQRLIAFFLERAGARVSVVGNGRQALDTLRASEPDAYDVLLLDMQMPEMDGYEAAARLREAEIEIPIVALTAHAMDGDRSRCIDAGCDDYLAKPIDRDRLVSTCRMHARGDGPRGRRAA